MKSDTSIIITRISRSSWFKVSYGDLVIHLDPGYAGYFRNQDIPIYELDDKADIIIVSHCHKDHLQAEALDMIRDADTAIIAPESCGSIIENAIFAEAGKMISVKGVDIIPVDAYNTPYGSSTRKVHHRGQGFGYLIRSGGRTLYFAGDTDLITEMAELGNVDIAFLPIGGTFVMDVHDAVDSVRIIRPGLVIPMHEAKNDPLLLEKGLESLANAILLKPGESHQIEGR